MFNFRSEVLKVASNRCGSTLDQKLISQDWFDLSFLDRSDFKSEAKYYQVREELRYFDNLIFELFFKEKRKFRALPKNLEKSQFYLTVLLGCNLEILTNIFELFDTFQEFYGESVEDKLLRSESRPDIPSMIFNFLIEVENKPFEVQGNFDFFKGLVDRNIVQKFENLKESNTIYFQLFCGGHPVVSDFQDQSAVELIKDKTQVVIKEKRISLRFRSHFARWSVLEAEREGGFTRLDLFELIFKKYKEACAREEPDCSYILNEVLVEGVYYNSPVVLYDVIAHQRGRSKSWY